MKSIAQMTFIEYVLRKCIYSSADDGEFNKKCVQILITLMTVNRRNLCVIIGGGGDETLNRNDVC
jgi:hypothetical protein